MIVCSDTTYLYTEPMFNENNIIGKLDEGSVVHVVAKNKDGWFVVTTSNQTGFVYKNFLKRQEVQQNYQETPRVNTIKYAKITGNNVNVRSSNSTKSQIIGFADKTDYFKIISYDGSWYQIDYLGQIGYIKGDFVQEVEKDTELTYQKMVYMTDDTYLYRDLGNTYMSLLPRYQNALVINEMNGYYQVNIDGVIGYVNKQNTKSLSKTCVVVDLSRQILKVYQNSREVYRAKIISGRKSMQTNIGCFKIGHRAKNYTFENSNIFNEYWIQFDGNIGLHPADANGGYGWQKEAYFEESAGNAYKNWIKGNGKTYPSEHGSHGCVNMQLEDIERIYPLVNVKDNVLVIGPNNLVRDNLISYQRQLEENSKVKKLQYFG